MRILCIGYRSWALDIYKIIKKGEMIDESGCEKIDAAGVKSIQVYSVITCGSKAVSYTHLTLPTSDLV